MRVSLDPAGKFMDLSPSFACLWDSILSLARQYLAYPLDQPTDHLLDHQLTTHQLTRVSTASPACGDALLCSLSNQVSRV